MPGTIRISVLEAVDLPEDITDGAVGKDVTAKVTLGPKLFKTQPGVADGGKIASWNSDFAFPVMNLRDKLVISICDSEDHSMTQTAIEIPSIIQKGSRDEFVALNKGGRIHLRMSFVLTEEERKKIETMREAALKRKEEAERLKKTVVMQPVTPEKQPRKSPVSTVAITEVDAPTTGDKKEPDDRNITGDATILAVKTDSAGDKNEATDKPMDSPTPGDKKISTPKRASPKPMFNYAKAIGVPPSAKKTVKKLSAAVSDSSTTEFKTENSEVTSGAQTVEESAKDASESTKLDPSVEPPRTPESVTKPVNSTTTEEAPGNVESLTKPEDYATVEEAMEAPRATESLTIPVNSAAPEEVDTSNQVPFSWGDEFKATNSSEVQIGREEPGNTDQAEIKPTDSVNQATPPSTEEPGNTDQAEIKPTDSVNQATPPSTKAETSEVGHSKLDPSNEEESSSLIMVPEDQQFVRSSSSGPLTLRTVKARVKRSLSRVSSMRSSTSLSRSSAQVPVVWVQEVVRRAMSNVKGCYGFNSPAVHH